MSASSIIPIPIFIDVSDVMTSMKCSRSTAYGHMRAALGRKPGERGQLRVPVYIWQRYIERTFDPDVREVEHAANEPKSPVRITRARSKSQRKSGK